MENQLGLWSMIAGAGIIVKLVLLLLIIFSVVSWAIMIYKYRYIKKVEKETDEFSDKFWAAGSFSAISALAKNYKLTPLSRLFEDAYAELSSSKRTAGETDAIGVYPDEIDRYKRILTKRISIEKTRIEQTVPFLATAGNTAPFIGLFGTVWGIMNSFRDIGAKGAASLAVVAPGISEALIATALGLFVAIPSVMGYNFLITRIDRLAGEMENFSSDLLNIIEKQVLKKQQPAREKQGRAKEGS